jgi:sirohydrochlorin ferrochelatase
MTYHLVRVPSIKSRITARTSAARLVRHSLGAKMPRGLGILTDPARAARQRIYQRTTVPLAGRSSKAGGWGFVLLALFIFAGFKLCGPDASTSTEAPAVQQSQP